MVATKDLKVDDGAPLEVWVTLIPASETYTWQNESECAKCPKSHPHNYGSAEAGIFWEDPCSAARAGGQGGALIPTHYYGGPGKQNFVLTKNPWLPFVTDEHEGRATGL